MASFFVEVKMRTYLVSYNHGGAQWQLELVAESAEDAKSRLARLPFGSVDGELITKVPAALGLFATLIAAIRNNLTRAAGNY